MDGSDAVWIGVFGVGTAVEVWALKNSIAGDTLSERVRRWFRVDTRTGKIVFTLAWLLFSGWFLDHIVN